MKARTLLAVVTAFLLAGCASPPMEPAAPTSPPSASEAQVMVVGVYHLSGQRDIVDSPVDDHRSPQRQAEIADVLDRLERFRPTRIVVEIATEHEDQFNTQYKRYLAGEETLGANEREQFGMALGRRLGHDRIYAADFPNDMDFNAMMRAAQQANQHDVIESLQASLVEAQAEQQAQAALGVRERLIVLNSPQALQAHNIYLTMAQVGTRQNPVGAQEMGEWWNRNLIIYARIAQVTEPGDRVLVFYGAGHKYLLDQFFSEAREFELVDPLTYLR